MPNPFDEAEFTFAQGNNNMKCSKYYCKNKYPEFTLYGVQIRDKEVLLCQVCFMQYMKFIEINLGES